MGQLRFVTPDRDRLPPGAVERAYLTGMEGVPFASRNFWEGEQFVIERDVRESGNLHLLWPVAERGPMLLTTASLMERDRPYLLPVELARGMLNRVRQQEAQWQAAGLTVPPEYDALEHEAQRHLGKAITQQADPRAAESLADAAIVASLAASDALCAAYRRQILAARHQQSPQLPTLLGATLPASPLAAPQLKLFQTAFNAAAVPLLWRDIEATEGTFDWSLADAQFQAIQKSSLKICTGPLLRLDSSTLPDWLYLWEDDFESLQGCIYQFLTAVVERYRSHVQVWHCAAGMNLPGGLLLTEEQKLRLAVLSIDTIRRADAKTPIVMSFDQPWGEYLQVAELDLPAYHFADALVRADLGLAGVGLEINLGYWPGGTLPRDGLEVSRMVDRWTALGVPLLAILTAPSAHGEDSLARHKAEVVMPATPASQANVLGPMLEMLIAKHSIHGVLWNQLSDGQPHAWPHGGVWDVAGKPKPLFHEIARLRKAHLA